jgi:hypothetical protein
LDRDDGAKGLKPTDVFHNGPGTNSASTGERNLGVTHSTEEGANAEETGAQAIDEFVWRFCIGELICG